MIPKIIHYCWLGRGEKPKLVKKCINSWKKHCPDYQIIEWNEDNLDIASAPLFVRQALEQKKWAFATDYIRYQVVYENGGIYLDTDVEIIKNLDMFLKNSAFFGFEKSNHNMWIASGLGFGAEKRNAFLFELMNTYENSSFYKPDGSMDTTACPARELSVFTKHGLKPDGTEQLLDNGIHIFPSDFFCPCDFHTGIVKKTKNTVSIHWYAASWYSLEQQQNRKKRLKQERKLYFCHIPNRIGMKVLGQEQYNKLKRIFGRR